MALGFCGKVSDYVDYRRNIVGTPLQFEGNAYTAHGNRVEGKARCLYEALMGVRVLPGGFARSNDGVFGASPDGRILLASENTGAAAWRLLEIKCPFRALYDAKKADYQPFGIPKAYLCQMQGQMHLVNVSTCDFFVMLERPTLTVVCMRVHRSDTFWRWAEPKLRMVSQWILTGLPDVVDRSFDFQPFDFRSMTVEPVLAPCVLRPSGSVELLEPDPFRFPVFFQSASGGGSRHALDEPAAFPPLVSVQSLCERRLSLAVFSSHLERGDVLGFWSGAREALEDSAKACWCVQLQWREVCEEVDWDNGVLTLANTLSSSYPGDGGGGATRGDAKPASPAEHEKEGGGVVCTPRTPAPPVDAWTTKAAMSFDTFTAYHPGLGWIVDVIKIDDERENRLSRSNGKKGRRRALQPRVRFPNRTTSDGSLRCPLYGSDDGVECLVVERDAIDSGRVLVEAKCSNAGVDKATDDGGAAARSATWMNVSWLCKHEGELSSRSPSPPPRSASSGREATFGSFTSVCSLAMSASDSKGLIVCQWDKPLRIFPRVSSPLGMAVEPDAAELAAPSSAWVVVVALADVEPIEDALSCEQRKGRRSAEHRELLTRALSGTDASLTLCVVIPNDVPNSLTVESLGIFRRGLPAVAVHGPWSDVTAWMVAN